MRGFHASGSALGKAWLSVCAMTALAAVAPANATIRVATYTGTLGNGYDKTGIFGAPGWISRLPYRVSYTYDTSLGQRTTDPGVSDKVLGGDVYGGATTPIIDTTLTINGVTVHIGSNHEGQAGTSENLVFHGTEYDAYDVDGKTVINHGSAFSYTALEGAPTDLDDLFPPTANGPTYYFASFLFNIYQYDPKTGSEVYTWGESGRDMTYSVDAPLPISAPEPASWALTIVGFGLVGGALRRRAYTPSSHVPSLSPA